MDSVRSPAPGAPLTRQQPQPPERYAARQPPPRPVGWALLPLRGYLAVVYLYAGLGAGASPDEVLARADADNAPFAGHDDLRAFVVQGLQELAPDA